jgi:eukaryotic-like serine/threonine-protein kinase
MGKVFQAIDTRLNRTAAVKTCAARLGEERRRRLAQAAAALSHFHVVTICDVGQTGGAGYIAMEYIEGVTLADHLRIGPRPPEEIARRGNHPSGRFAYFFICT